MINTLSFSCRVPLQGCSKPILTGTAQKVGVANEVLIISNLVTIVA